MTCTSNVAGALLQLFTLMVYWCTGVLYGRYWCTLSDVRSANLEISVAGRRARTHTQTHVVPLSLLRISTVAPTFKLENVSVYWVRDAKVNVSWSLPDPPPWMGVLGYKLNWDKVPPIPIVLMSVGAEKFR